MNEIRLIDANALKEKLLNTSRKKITSTTIKKVFPIIDEAPTVEPTFKPVATVNFDKEQLQEIVDKAKAEVLASVERPQGKWIYTDKEDKEKGYGGYCSVCKCDMPIGMNDWKQEYYESNFCPNCGADMRKGESE